MASSFYGTTQILLELLANNRPLGPLLQESGNVGACYQDNYTPGSSAFQISQIYAAQFTLAQSATQTLRLTSGGTLKDVLGNSLSLTRVLGVFTHADLGNSLGIWLKPTAVNGALLGFNAITDQAATPPGGSLMLTSPSTGWPLVDGTTDSLDLINADPTNSSVIDICIWG